MNTFDFEGPNEADRDLEAQEARDLPPPGWGDFSYEPESKAAPLQGKTLADLFGDDDLPF